MSAVLYYYCVHQTTDNREKKKKQNKFPSKPNDSYIARKTKPN